MIRASVIVCTHNRAGMLARAVERAAEQCRSRGDEVVVVDNASTDDTALLLADLARRLPEVRVTGEPELGLSAARNRGLATARGAVGVFLDDDADPHPGWLDAILRPFEAPTVAAAGGPIRLRFDGATPAWLRPELVGAFSGYDAGGTPRVLHWQPGDEFPYGANIAFRVATARRLGGFSRWVGPRGRLQLVHDETDLCYRLDRAGAEIRYVPDAVVDHRIPADRAHPAWVIDRFRQCGRSAATFELRNRGVHRALGRFRWVHAQHLAARPYTPYEPVDSDRLVAECRRQEAIGYVLGLAAGLPRLRALRRDLVGGIAA